MTNITGKFDWQIQKVVPAVLQGEDAAALWQECEEIKTGVMGYDSDKKLIFGSTQFLAARVDTIVRPLGLRVTNLRDLSRPEIMILTQGNHYIDSPTMVIRSEQDSDYPLNNKLIQKIMNEASRLHEKLPFMVTGFDSAVCPDGGYNRTIVPRGDFKIIRDERLDGKYDYKTFEKVDKLGLPIFDKNGTRIWHARNQGAASVFLKFDFSLDTSIQYLAGSAEAGRIVLIRN